MSFLCCLLNAEFWSTAIVDGKAERSLMFDTGDHQLDVHGIFLGSGKTLEHDAVAWEVHGSNAVDGPWEEVCCPAFAS